MNRSTPSLRWALLAALLLVAASGWLWWRWGGAVLLRSLGAAMC